MAAVVLRRRLLQENCRHDAEVMDDRRARVDDLTPPAPRMKAVELDQAAGGEDHRRGRHGERVHVKERQRREEAPLAEAQRAQPAFIAAALADLEEIKDAEPT